MLVQTTNSSELGYLALLEEVLHNGSFRSDRTGTGTYSLFGRQLRFNLQKGFPLLTTKKVFLRGIIVELLWFLKGDSNIKFLVDHNVNIWNEWPYRFYRQTLFESNQFVLTQEEFIEKIRENEDFAEKWGKLGPVYGVQWRHWKSPDGTEIDQIARLIEQIKTTPDSRRLLVSAWNVADIEEMAKAGLPPCHTLFQFYVSEGQLSCQLYQRSADLFLGVPFNIASYALLTMMLAQVCGLRPGEFVHTFGDVHIYSNHVEQVHQQLQRTPRPLPMLKINPEVGDIDQFRLEDFTLLNYEPYPAIKAQVAV